MEWVNKAQEILDKLPKRKLSGDEATGISNRFYNVLRPKKNVPDLILTTPAQAMIMEGKIKQLEADNRTLKEALDFYAKEKHMGGKGRSYMRSDCYAVDDGTVARKALKEIKKENYDHHN